jgi:hypothetical protein
MTVTYSFESNVMTNLNGEKKREKKSIVDGDQGVTVYYLRKTDSAFKKVRAQEKAGVFSVSMKIGEDETTKDMDEAEFLKMAKKDEDLDFVVSYMKKRLRGGAKRTVKKTSKVVKKSSKKTSRRVRRVAAK